MRTWNVLLAHTLFIVAISGLTPVSAAEERWYSAAEAKGGKPLYEKHCASCHGKQARGTADWRKALADGSMPPPPLNGTAHTWHHPLGILARQIADGGKPVGGKMPAFKQVLEADQIRSVIAYFQSLWPDNIYQAWLPRSGLPKVAAKESPPAAQGPTRFLSQLARGRTISKPMPTPVAGIQMVKLGGTYLYVTNDGRYILTGDLIDLKAGRNLTEHHRRSVARKRLDAVSDADKVIYPAKGVTRATIDIFTDTSCPYCRRLHAEVPKLQAVGVTVRYLPYPRGGAEGAGYEGLKRVWCAAAPAASVDAEMSGAALPGPTADCARAKQIERGYRLGRELGIEGTPAIFLPSGELVNGYLPATELIRRLGLR